MNFNGFSARIMRAIRLTGEGVHDLPSGRQIPVYPVDSFKEPLSSWIPGQGNYVIPVDPDWGLWFDWTVNDEMNTAVLMSIKGMNPITGQRSNGFSLERYVDKCPVHDEPFKEGLFCEKCNFKWPAQNYVSYPNRLWWDGFRTGDGKVRQFFFTEDLAKSIPELVIGKEDTVPAFGFAFFKPKVRRERPAIQATVWHAYNESFKYSTNHIVKSSNFLTSTQCYAAGTVGLGESNPDHNLSVKKTNTKMALRSFESSNSSAKSLSNSRALTTGMAESYTCLDSASFYSNVDHESGVQGVQGHKGPSGVAGGACVDLAIQQQITTPVKEVGVGAGAEINQQLVVDQLKVTDWDEKPSSVMRLFFVFQNQFEEVKAKGMNDLVGETNGYMSGLPVG